MPSPRPDPAITPELTTWLAGAGLAVKGSYRIDELMLLLTVSRRTVYRMIEDGTLDALHVERGVRRYSPTRIPLYSVARLIDPQ